MPLQRNGCRNLAHAMPSESVRVLSQFFADIESISELDVSLLMGFSGEAACELVSLSGRATY